MWIQNNVLSVSQYSALFYSDFFPPRRLVFIYLFICLFIYLFICLFIYPLFIYLDLFIYLFDPLYAKNIRIVHALPPSGGFRGCEGPLPPALTKNFQKYVYFCPLTVKIGKISPLTPGKGGAGSATVLWSANLKYLKV